MLFFRGRLPELVIFLLAGTVQAETLSLAEAERIALEEEPGRAALLERAGALREQAVAAGQLPDPKLRVALANFPLESGGFSTEGMTQAQLGVRQAFPPGNTRAVRARRFESMAREVSENASARRRDVLTSVRTRWLDAWYWMQADDIVSGMRPMFADLVTITQSMYAVGRRDQQDVLRAELELSRLDDFLIEIEKNRSASRARLSEWVGQDAGRPLGGELPAWQSLPPLGQLQQQLDSHPAVLAADAGIAAASDGVELATQRNKPGWALDVGYAYRDGRLPGGGSRSDFATVAFTFDLPYFRKNRQDREVAAARGQRRASSATREQLVRRLASQLEAEFVQWQELSRRIDLYERVVLKQAQAQARAALAADQSESGDFAGVMRGSIDELDTRLDFVRLQVDRARSYAVLANLGGLTQ